MITLMDLLHQCICTGGPLYSRSFLSVVSIIRGPKTAFFEEPMVQFKPYIGLFIHGFVIRGPIFEERTYRE